MGIIRDTPLKEAIIQSDYVWDFVWDTHLGFVFNLYAVETYILSTLLFYLYLYF